MSKTRFYQVFIEVVQHPQLYDYLDKWLVNSCVIYISFDNEDTLT